MSVNKVMYAIFFTTQDPVTQVAVTEGKSVNVKFYKGKAVTSGWSGGANVLGKLPVPGRPTIWITVGQGPTALAVGAGGGCLEIFTLIYPFFPLSPSLWETARYRLKYCLKGPLNSKQPTKTVTKLKKHFSIQRSSTGLANVRLLYDNASSHKTSIVQDFLKQEKNGFASTPSEFA